MAAVLGERLLCLGRGEQSARLREGTGKLGELGAGSFGGNARERGRRWGELCELLLLATTYFPT